MGVAAAQIFTVYGAAYGTAKSAVGIHTMGVMHPEIMVFPFCSTNSPLFLTFLNSSPFLPEVDHSCHYGWHPRNLRAGSVDGHCNEVASRLQRTTIHPLQRFCHLAAGLTVGLCGLASGYAIGIVRA